MSVKLKELKLVHPAVSDTVTSYNPAVKPEISSVVSNVLHKKEGAPLAPVTVISKLPIPALHVSSTIKADIINDPGLLTTSRLPVVTEQPDPSVIVQE